MFFIKGLKTIPHILRILGPNQKIFLHWT